MRIINTNDCIELKKIHIIPKLIRRREDIRRDGMDAKEILNK